MNLWPAITTEDLRTLESLSWEIIHEHYDPYMDPDHVEFYLNKYQTVSALEQQLKFNHLHYLIQINRAKVGFLTLQIMDKSLRISKLYIHQSARNNGLGRDILDFIGLKAEKLEKSIIDLVVNQKNKAGIRFYERNGFKITKELVNHFENGHSEEDYLMSREEN